MFEVLSACVPHGNVPQVDSCGPDPAFDGGGPDEVVWHESWRDEPGWGDPLDAPPSEPLYGTDAPSGWLALELDTGTTDPAALSDGTLIEAVVGFDRLTSWAAARQARLLAELLHRRDPDTDPSHPDAHNTFAADEISVALHLARGVAAGRLDLADRLLHLLPDTHALWESGRIDTAKARAIHDATDVLTDELATKVEALVLPKAPQQSLAQLRAALARAILAVDPDGAADRHREARKDRRVSVQPEAEGMASLWALLTATDAAGAYEWLTRLARGLGPDDPRSMDTRRADLLAELLNGRLVANVELVDHDPDDGPDTTPDPTAATADKIGHDTPDGGTPDGGTPDGDTPEGATTHDRTASTGTGTSKPTTSVRRPTIHPVTPGKPIVQIVMAHSTLIGADDQPAELTGYGPIPADLARDTAADAVWRRLVTDPLSGAVLDYGRTTYHPPAALADHVKVRDQHCRFPHCRRRAADAELDHALAWADGGETSAANLHALCRRHHTLKHHAGWRIQAHPDGRLTWITPTGHRHTTTPHDYGPEPPPTSSSDDPVDAPPEPSRMPTVAAGPDADPDPPLSERRRRRRGRSAAPGRSTRSGPSTRSA